jgi:hypothetical protein
LNPARQLTRYEKYGAIPGFNTKGNIPWNKGLTAETNDSLASASTKLKEKYRNGQLVAYNPMTDPKVRIKHKEAMKKAYSNYTRRTPGKFKYGWYKGIWCDSSWELAYLLYCFDNNIDIERNKLGFSYIWEDSVHKYFPDFYLPASNTFVEIKGYKTKRDEAKISQFNNNLLVLCADEMKDILAYVQKVYGKQFTDLYESKVSNLP